MITSFCDICHKTARTHYPFLEHLMNTDMQNMMDAVNKITILLRSDIRSLEKRVAELERSVVLMPGGDPTK